MFKQISSRIKIELYNKISALAAEKLVTMSEIIIMILESYFSRPVETAQTVDLQQLQALEIENNQLKTNIEALNQQIETIRQNPEIKEIERIIEIEKQGIYLELGEKENQFLTLALQRYNEKTRQNLTAGQMLFSLFYNQLVKGPGDWLPEIISKNRMEALITASQNQQKNE